MNGGVVDVATGNSTRHVEKVAYICITGELKNELKKDTDCQTKPLT